MTTTTTMLDKSFIAKLDQRAALEFENGTLPIPERVARAMLEEWNGARKNDAYAVPAEQARAIACHVYRDHMVRLNAKRPKANQKPVPEVGVTEFKHRDFPAFSNGVMLLQAAIEHAAHIDAAVNALDKLDKAGLTLQREKYLPTAMKEASEGGLQKWVAKRKADHKTAEAKAADRVEALQDTDKLLTIAAQAAADAISRIYAEAGMKPLSKPEREALATTVRTELPAPVSKDKPEPVVEAVEDKPEDKPEPETGGFQLDDETRAALASLQAQNAAFLKLLGQK